jgi:hypothetical protein
VNIQRSPVIVALLSLTAVAMSGCTSNVDGQPSTLTSPTPTSTSTSQIPLSSLDSCTLLDEALSGQGFPAGIPSIADPKQSCDTKKADYGGVALDLVNGKTIDQNGEDPSKVQAGDVNGRRSIRIIESLGSQGDCEIQMEVKPNSLAAIVASLRSGTTADACNFADNVAAKVEPLLPKNN